MRRSVSQVGEHRPTEEIIELAVQIGIEQGRRINLSSGFMPAHEVVETLIRYLETMDLDVKSEQIDALLASATRKLFASGAETTLPASPALRAKLRPSNFAELSAAEQWEIDKGLGILDWDGRDDAHSDR